MKFSNKQIVMLLVLLAVMVVAIWMLREEVLGLLNMEG